MDIEITPGMIFFGILVYAIHLFLLFIVIKDGVKSAQKNVVAELERQNELLFKLLSEKDAV